MCAAAVIETLGLTKNRLEALVDGVFATLMTVLVLTLTLPPSSIAAPALAQRLALVGHPVLAYALSFIVLGVYWVGHHNMFHYVRRTTRVFLWLNVLFLLTVGFIPFSTTILGDNLLDPVAIIFYGVNLLLAGMMLYLIWWFATRRRHLVEKDLDPHLVASVNRRILTGPIFYLSAIAFAYVEPVASILLYVAALLFFILPGHVDIHFTRKHH